MQTIDFNGVVVEYVDNGEFAHLLADWELEAEHNRIETDIDIELIKWLHSPEAKNDINYSDIYKDVFGVRPRP